MVTMSLNRLKASWKLLILFVITAVFSSFLLGRDGPIVIVIVTWPFSKAIEAFVLGSMNLFQWTVETTSKVELAILWIFGAIEFYVIGYLIECGKRKNGPG